VKTSCGKVVVTSILYLTVHRWIAGDVTIYRKLALKVTHPSRKCRFRQILLNSAAAMRASKKVELSLIESRQCAFHRAIDEPCTLPLSPPKGGSTREFLHLALPFHFFVAGNRRHFKLHMWVEHSKSQPTDDKTSLKWAWPRHVTHFKLLVPLRYLWNDLC